MVALRLSSADTVIEQILQDPLLLARNCTLATLPFQHVKKENRPGRVDAQCGAARVGATLEEIHDMKMESWIMRVLSITVTILGQTWDLEAGYARDEWT